MATGDLGVTIGPGVDAGTIAPTSVVPRNRAAALAARVFVLDLPPVPERLRRGWGRLTAPLDRLHRPDPLPEPYVAGVTKLGAQLWRPAAMGFFASLAVLLGATQANSPFTSKITGAWFFGIPAPSVIPGYQLAPGQGLFLGVVLVYGGALVLIRAWYNIVKLTARHPGIPVARLVPVFIAWMLPMLIVAPLFSRDIYAYAAQGEMMSHGINPYLYGTNVLGATPFSHLVDPMWGNVGSPYGPIFLIVDGWIVTAAHHDLLGALVGLRALAVLGVILFAVTIPFIARSFDRDAATASALVALSPLVLLHLVAGAHNDALMIGLLAVGYALSRRGRPVLGIVICGIAAAVKIPALIGAVYIGWEWLGTGRTVRQRLRPVGTALVLALATMAALSEAVGLGWGWISGLTNPDTVRSWMDPATGIGLFLGHAVGWVGFGNHIHVILTVARGTSFALAIVIGIRLLLRSDQIGPLRAMGWTLIAFVVLGPVVQPWYVSWGFVFLAPIAEGTVRRTLIVISAVACFLGLPGAVDLLHELELANPALIAAAAVVLVAIGVGIVVPRYHRETPSADQLASSAVPR